MIVRVYIDKIISFFFTKIFHYTHRQHVLCMQYILKIVKQYVVNNMYME